MLSVADHFPEYELTACVALDPQNAFTTLNHKSYEGKWRVVFFWPKDFTFVCPTEIAEFGRLNGDFADRDAQVLGVSVDNEYVHHAWRKNHPDLRDLPFPMLADVKRELSAAAGVLGEDGVAQRATFIIDPDNEIQFAMVTAGSVGRNVSEVLRVLDALQTDELCPCNWKAGEATLDQRQLLGPDVGLDALKAALPDYAKDTRLNLSSVLTASTLPAQRLWGTALATAVAARNAVVLREIAAEAEGFLKPEAVTAAKAAASIMAMNNVYYRAKHLIGDEGYQSVAARLRMQVIGNPGVDKVDFELWSLAVSAITGCGVCLESHEKALRAAGLSREEIHEALRIAAVIHAAAVTLDAEAALAG